MSITLDPTPLSKCVNQSPIPISSNNRGIDQKIFNIFKQALRPFISLFSLISNKLYTGRFLTTNRIIASDMDSGIMKCWKNLTLELKGEVQEKMASKEPFVTLIHTPCLKHIPHSTMLAIGRTKEGNAFALFFDAQGTHPSDSKLMNSMESGAWEGQSVNDLYNDFTENMTVKPDLFFSTSNIQADFVSCTAYSAVFQQKLKHAFLTENFCPESFMQGVANNQTISFLEARRVISNFFSA